MDNLYEKIKKHPIKYGIIILVLLAAVQLGIDYAYILGRTYPIIITSLDASDVLSYWSVFIGAVVTIAGVYITISYYKEQTDQLIENGNETTRQIIKSNRDDSEETNRKSVLPFVVINRVVTKHVGLSFFLPSDETDTEEQDLGYVEKAIEEFILIISPKKLSVQHELNKSQKDRVSSAFKGVRDGNKIAMCQPDYVYMPFKLTNVGQGPAINMTLTLIKDKLFGDVNYHIQTLALSMKIDTELTLGFFVDKPTECMGSYNLKIEYHDVHNVKYVQEHELTIEENTSYFNLEINQSIVE